METIKIQEKESIEDIEPHLFQRFLAVFERADAFVYPTDTVYGLGANALDEQAIERIFKIKKRPLEKPVPVLVSSLEMAKEIAYINKEQEKIIEKVWPGAVTLVFEKRPKTPNILTGGKRTIGLRAPKHKFILELIEKLNCPITGTSANISGNSPKINPKEIIKEFKNASPAPQIIFDAGVLNSDSPSTVMDMTKDEPSMLRIGPITKKDLNF